MEKTDKWYFKNSFFGLALFLVGPLALPLAWFNPRFSRKRKIIITFIVLAISVVMMWVFARSMKAILEYYQQLQSILKES